MLRLFKSMFRIQDEPGRYPDSLVREAIERAVEGTDPWLRGVSGYRKKLRPAVVNSIDHVIQLIDGLAPPTVADPARYAEGPLLKAYFVSAGQMREVLSRDPAFLEYCESHGALGEGAVFGLLVMEKDERQSFGTDLVGEALVRDVAKTTVSFSEHYLVDLTPEEVETRRMLKRRAFDHLLTMALAKVVALRDERERLGRRRTLLQSKLNLLQTGRWGFDAGEKGAGLSVGEVEAELAQIEAQLLEHGGEDQAIEAELEVVREVLAQAGKYLWADKEKLIIDTMGVKRNLPGLDAPELELDRIQNAAGRTVIVSMLKIPEGSL